MAMLLAALLAHGVSNAVAQPALRIVSLAPHLTENLFAAGLGGQVVGADEYSDYPPDAKKIPRIGRSGALDIERIVALKPDLVLAWESGNPAGQVAQLRRLGLNVMVTEQRTAADVATFLRQLAKVSAGEAAMAALSPPGERAAAEFERGWAELGARYRNATPVTVFYQIWHEPLMTVSGQHSISEVLRLCGGQNVFAALPALAGTVSVEAVLRANPQAIVGSGSDGTRPLWLDDWRRWPQLRAVKTGALIDVPPDLMQRPTPRLLDGARRVCAGLDKVRAARTQAGR